LGDFDATGYLVDTLFRSDHPDTNANPQEVRAEATRIIVSGLRTGDVPPAGFVFGTFSDETPAIEDFIGT
jgi:hypothetical protein